MAIGVITSTLDQLPTRLENSTSWHCIEYDGIFFVPSGIVVVSNFVYVVWLKDLEMVARFRDKSDSPANSTAAGIFTRPVSFVTSLKGSL